MEPARSAESWTSKVSSLELSSHSADLRARSRTWSKLPMESDRVFETTRKDSAVRFQKPSEHTFCAPVRRGRVQHIYASIPSQAQYRIGICYGNLTRAIGDAIRRSELGRSKGELRCCVRNDYGRMRSGWNTS